MEPTTISRVAQSLATELEHVIVGKSKTVKEALLVLFCEGHLLIEDVPGVGKTTLAKAIAKAVGGDFRRIQFTPDLLPSDVTGTSILNRDTHRFEFQPGPIFANVVLADEINRATPKTQSALLEAMEERHVTTDGVERPTPTPFMVIATQNNIEMMGTFPLPEAQLDRFFGRISLGYPDQQNEAKMLESQQISHPLEKVRTVTSPDELCALQRAIREIHVDEKVRNYIVDIVRSTREDALIALGSSPRGSIHLMHGAQANAAIDGRSFVTPDDVKAVASLVLAHRIITRGEMRHGLEGSAKVITTILDRIPAPLPLR